MCDVIDMYDVIDLTFHIYALPDAEQQYLHVYTSEISQKSIL